MISICNSHSLEKLSDRLISDLEQTSEPDPFSVQHIIVPNLDTAGWLKLQIAEQSGIAANLRFMLPAEWQWSQARKIYPSLPDLLPSDPAPMRWTLFDLLSDSEFREQYSLLKNYINDYSTGEVEGALSGLSMQIATVFDQYLVHRPKMLLSWKKGTASGKDEKWQADLWNHLDAHWKSVYSDERALNKAELFEHTLKALEQGKITSENPLFVFNPGLMPGPVAEMLSHPASQAKIFIYRIQPSAKAGEPRNELLAAFGSESARAKKLFEFEGSKQTDDFNPDNSGTELGNIKAGIILNKELEKSTGNNIPNDIHIRSCHSPYREVEVLFQFLLEQFEDDDSLNPEDILVVTPEPELYRHAIDAVFGNPEDCLPAIPYHIGLKKGRDTLGVERAFQQLLKLADSRFELSDVMDLFSVEAVRNKFGVSESEEKKIRRWMEYNNVIWGMDGGHRKEWGQPDDPLHTWQMAVRRMWLGQSSADKTGRMMNNLILFKGIESSSEKEIWASFSSFLMELADIHKEALVKRSGLLWCKLIEKWIYRIIIDKNQYSEAHQSIIKLIKKISNSFEASGTDNTLSLSVIRDEIILQADSRKSGTSSFTRGVLFSSMVPLRSIPFKVIALLGLNDGVFPRKQVSPEFDLITKYPALADRNRKEEDRNLFLESILAAKKIHYCSFTGQDPTDNEEIALSPVVSEWVDYIARISNRKPEEVIRKESLTAFSPLNFSAEKKNYSSLFRNTARKITGNDRAVSGLSVVKSLPAVDNSVEISVDDLASFFSNPVRYFLKNKFDVSFREPGRETDEFSPDNLKIHQLFQYVLGWKLSAREDEQIYNLLLQSGELPAGWPGRKKLDEILSQVQFVIEELKHHDYEPELTDIDLDFSTGNYKISGSVQTYSKDKLLDISISGSSGKLLVSHWVKHLCVAASQETTGESILLCSVKSKPEWFHFKPVENAGELLCGLIQLREQSEVMPQNWFPGTSYKYEKAEMDGRSMPIQIASAEFEGTGNNKYEYPERDDLYIKHLMGEGVPFQEDFLKNDFQRMMKKMTEHIDVKK